MAKRLVFNIDSLSADSRLDKYLSQQTEIHSRARAEYLIDERLVTVNGKPVKSSYRLKESDLVEVSLPEPKPSVLEPLNLKLDIVFEDSDLIVVNKPAGLVVHPAAGHQSDTLVNALLFHTKDLSMKFGEDRPGIVHRIDRDTSGLLVVAKNDFTHQALSDQFKQRTITRLYEAVCIGVPRAAQGIITSVIARHPTDRKRFASIKDSAGKFIVTPNNDATGRFQVGKLAVTSYQVIKNRTTASLVELKLFTGRTHQIRVHMSELGIPLLGDSTYSSSHILKKISSEMKSESENLNRFLLHAKILGFVHPKTGKTLNFKIDWPKREKVFIEKWFK